MQGPKHGPYSFLWAYHGGSIRILGYCWQRSTLGECCVTERPHKSTSLPHQRGNGAFRHPSLTLLSFPDQIHHLLEANFFPSPPWLLSLRSDSRSLTSLIFDLCCPFTMHFLSSSFSSTSVKGSGLLHCVVEPHLVFGHSGQGWVGMAGRAVPNL